MYTGKFKVNGKIWLDVGFGTVLATPVAGTLITGVEPLLTREGISYMRLTSPTAGYTKVSFLEYVIAPAPVPDPVPTPTPAAKVVDISTTYSVATGKARTVYIMDDGTIRVIEA